MKERPISMSASMVRAILEGRKTQTRRVVKAQPACPDHFVGLSQQFKFGSMYWYQDGTMDAVSQWRCPYGKVGDRLWVRETFADVTRAFQSYDCEDMQNIAFRADNSVYIAGGAYLEQLGDSGIFVDKWKPSIFMPRYASRLTLKITDVRVERLQSISDSDCEAEGVRPSVDGDARDWLPNETGWQRTYRQLWGKINGKQSWNDNPFVWVVKFMRLENSDEKQLDRTKLAERLKEHVDYYRQLSGEHYYQGKADAYESVLDALEDGQFDDEEKNETKVSVQ